jgi:hypothetical protein
LQNGIGEYAERDLGQALCLWFSLVHVAELIERDFCAEYPRELAVIGNLDN